MRARRALKVIAVVLGAVVGGLVVLAGLALAALHTSWGGERVRALVIPRVNQTIAGRLTVDRLALHGVGIELGDVTLFDPEGLVVARVARMQAAVALRPLLSGDVDVTRIEIERPALDLVQSAAGLNLVRATAPRHLREPAAPEPPSDPSQMQIALRQLHIGQGVVSYRDTRPAAGDPVRVEGIDVTAAGSVALPAQRFDGRIAIDARPRQPVDAPLALRLDGKGVGAAADATLSITLGQGRVLLRAHSADAVTQTLFIDQLSLPPDLVRALAPTAPLLATVAARGKVNRQGDAVTAHVNVDAAATRVVIDADVDVARLFARSVAVDATQIDLAHLIAGAPPSRFDLRLRASGGGRTLETLTGKVDLTVPAGTLDARPVGPVRVAATAAGGRFQVAALDVALPGLSLSGWGQGSQQSLSFNAKLVARDLALLAKSARLPRSLGLRGHGTVSVTLGGRPDAISAQIKGAVPSLSVAGAEATSIAIDVRAPNLQAAPAGAAVALSVASLRTGDTALSNLALQITSAADNGMTVAASVAKPLPVRLAAAGRVTAQATRIDLATMTLSYPGADWRLIRPAQILRQAESLAISNFELHAPPAQRLALDVEQRPKRIKALIELAGIDLERLPAALLPPGTKVAGRLDARVQASGAAARPDAHVTLSLANAKVGPLQDLALSLQAQHRRGRLVGDVTAHALAADHRVTFDLPVQWPPPPGAALALKAHVGQIDLATVAALTTKPGQPVPPVKGRAAVDLSVDGQAADPTLVFDATAQQLAFGGDRLDDVHVTVRDPAGQPLVMQATTKVLGRQSLLRVETPAVVGRWLRHPPRNDEWLDVPFVVKAEVDQLPLAPLGGRTGGKSTLGGTVTARAALTGPVSRLQGTLAVDAVDVRAPRLPATSATLRTRLGQGSDGIDTTIKVARRGSPVADLTAKVGLGIADLLARRSLASAPIKVDGHVGPITVQRVALGGAGGRRNGRRLRAAVGASLTLGGTLGNPHAEVRLAVNEARMGDQALGTATVKLNYRDAKPTVDLRLSSARGGGLEVTGDARVDLSLPAIMKGIVVPEIPINSLLRARDLDLSFLSVIHDDVRSVDGTLQADATLNGRIGAPQLVGRVGWQKGRVVLAELGEIRDIELALRGDQREMTLERLFARAGNGHANITAKAVRQPDGRRLTLQARAKVDRFRVQTEGQPLGSVSLDAHAEGTVAPDRIAIAATIDEAHLELAGGDRRRLQSLTRPTDVVVFSDGQPANRRQARRYDAIVERKEARAQAAALATNGKTNGASTPAKTDAARRSDDPQDTRITVQAPRNLWVRGPDVNLELGIDPDFVVNMTGEPRVFGTVRIRRGFVVVLGRRFDLTAGSSVRFQGPADVPVLSVDAVHRADKADATVQVHVEGAADALKFTLRSPEHPEWGDTELLSVLATGRPPDEPGGGGTSPGSQAASLLGGLLADRLQKTLTARLPIDVLVIQPGDNLLGPTLEAGTYFGDDIYVAYVGRLADDEMGRQNRNEVHLEYQLTSRWSFEATYGDARRGSADLLWTRHY